jgi:hypothetical protein
VAASEERRINVKNGDNGMIHYKDYIAGWMDSSIGDFMESFPRTQARMDFALITSLDSDLCPSKLLDASPELKSLGRAAKPLGSGVLVPTSLILKTDVQIFCGFDEVWFFPHEKIVHKPHVAWLVGPNRIDQKKLDLLGSWFVRNECSLALGDGDGLNFLVKARGLVKYLLAFSMLQPEPETGGEEETDAKNSTHTRSGRE